MKFDSRIRMACSTSPLARVCTFESHRGALVIEPLDSSLVNVGKGIVLDHQILAKCLAAHLNAVLALGGQFGNIDQLYILAACIPERGGARRYRKHSLARGILDFNIARGSDKRKFLGIGRAETHLVNVSVSGKGRRRQNGRRIRGRGMKFIFEFIYQYSIAQTHRLIYIRFEN